MKKINFKRLTPLFVICLLITISIQSCDPDDDDLVYKPNIYIYPTEETTINLKINFPQGGEIVESIPEYNNGWKVNVKPNGLINDNYSFLFYESKQPYIWQKKYGWIIKSEELETFFKNNMTAYGFKGKEIDDFIEYWIPRLKEYSSYTIYPQNSEIINKVIDLDFSQKPERLLRLFYVINGTEQGKETIQKPEILEFDREGYFITEWGVILN